MRPANYKVKQQLSKILNISVQSKRHVNMRKIGTGSV